MKTTLAIASIVIILAVKGLCQTVISVNFVGGGAVGGTPTPLATTDAAGVVVATNWNNIAQNLATGTASSLLDNSGKLTSAGVTWSSDDTWSTLISQTSPNFKLMKGYLDNTSDDIVVSASGVPYPSYNVYVYFNDDNTSGGTIGSYSIGNAKIYGKDAGALFNGVFTKANGTNVADTNAVGNYVVFQGLSGPGFTLTAHPEDTNHRSPVNGLQIVANSFAGSATATQIAAGENHSLFLRSNGSLWGMGENIYGQLGDGTYNNSNRPEQIIASNTIAIAAGEYFSLFLRSDGSLWGMGHNELGDLGNATYNTSSPYGTNAPQESVSSNVTAIAAGGFHSLFLESDGSLWAMGVNDSGELGDGTYNQTNRPERIVTNSVMAIAAGSDCSLLLKNDGSLWVMGFNGFGELGDGTYNETNRPERLMASNVVAIAAGSDYSLFLKSDGSLWGMGNNDYAQLGDGTYNQTNRPERIVASNVVAIAAGGSHSLYVKSDGTLWGMGDNSDGELGNYYGGSAVPGQIFPYFQVSASPTNGTEPLNVQFMSSNADVSGNSIVSWNWNFGDGSTGAGQNPSHTFTTNGIFYPIVIATNNLGAKLFGYAPPIFVTPVQFIANPTIGAEPLTVYFSAPGVDNQANPLIGWNWNFGDSSTGTGQFPTHTYFTVGEFQPTLVATNNLGKTVQITGPGIGVEPCVPISGVSATYIGQETESDGIHFFFVANVQSGSSPLSYSWNTPTTTNCNLIAYYPNPDNTSEIEVVVDRTSTNEAVGVTVSVSNGCGGGSGPGSGTACGTCLSPDEPNLLAAGAGAGTGPTKTNLCGITSINTRWYEMQAGNSGPITVGTVGSSNLNQLAVYRGISFASLTYLGCTTNRPARITFNATSNAVYYFALDPGTNNASNLGLTYGYEPPIENYSLTKGTFALQSGVAPPLGYQVLASTNLTLNISNWSVVLTTNWSLSNSNYFNYRLNYIETNMNKFPRRFYRLAP